MNTSIDLKSPEFDQAKKPRGKRNRTSAYYRHHRYRSINRKYPLVRLGIWWIPADAEGRDIKGHLAKGKTHCGCGNCILKTRKHGWKISDLRKLDKHALREV